MPAALGLCGVLRHEWWRDEAYTWLVVRASGSVAELVANLGFNGHPRLYYVLAWALYRVTADPLVLSLTNLALMVAAIALFFRSAPVSPLQAILFSLGFYPLYQYGVIARSYALLMVLLFAYCHLRVARPAAVVARLLVLVALAQVHLLATAAAAVLLATDAAVSRCTPRWRAREWAAAGSVAASLALAAWQMAPAGARPAVDALDAAALYRGFANGFLPDYGLLRGVRAQEYLGLGLFLASFVVLFWHGRALVAYLLLSGSRASICWFVYGGYRWHHGFYFVYLLVALWLFAERPLRRPAAYLVTAVLGLHLFIGLDALCSDLLRPYSDGELAARQLRERGLAGLPVVGMLAYRTPAADGAGVTWYRFEIDQIQPVLLHLPRGAAYDPLAGAFAPYFKHYALPDYFPSMERGAMERALREVAGRVGGRFVVVAVWGRGLQALAGPEPLRKLLDLPEPLDYGERYSLFLYE